MINIARRSPLSHWMDFKGSPFTPIFHFAPFISYYLLLLFCFKLPFFSFFDPHATPFLFFFYVAKEKEWENIHQQIQQLS